MLGAVQVLRNHFRGGGGQAKVLQIITIFKGGDRVEIASFSSTKSTFKGSF